MWPRVKTAVAVVLLSGLIWVYAERQVTQSAETTITVALPSGSFNLPIAKDDILVQFVDQEHNNEILPFLFRRATLNLEGPGGRIHDLREEKDRQVQINLPHIPNLPAEAAGDYTFNVVREIMEGTLSHRGGSLNVVGSDPELIRIRWVRLTKQNLPIKVRDAVGNELAVESIKPNIVEQAPVQGQAEAVVILSDDQKARATKAAVSAVAKWIVAGRTAECPVMVQLARDTVEMVTDKITPRLYVSLPPEMLGKYEVVLTKNPGTESLLDDVTNNNNLEAMTAPIMVSVPQSQLNLVSEWQINCPYHLDLVVQKEDMKAAETGELIPRNLVYHLPPDYQGQLQVVDKNKRQVWFILQPVAAATPEPPK